MKCPHCSYEPNINEFDWCEAPGRFFEIGLEMKQQPEGWNRESARELFYGCPRCGILFMNMGYEP